MRINTIKALIKLVEESTINELEVSGWGRKIAIRKQPKYDNHQGNYNPNTTIHVKGRTQLSKLEHEIQQNREDNPKKPEYILVKSPMVGTFYRAPAPDQKPYVEIGTNVRKGQTLCIIEAMKLMNEIPSEDEGTIAEICVENNKPVQFGQDLFKILPIEKASYVVETKK